METCVPNADEKSININYTPDEWFANMVNNCHQYALKEKESGKHIVGIMCEFTPREIIMAAGGVPACLCGGSNDTIPEAEKVLPANLCPLIKSTYGYHMQKSNPFLELAELIIAETTCDGKKKMFEQLGKTKEMYVLELPQKSQDTDALDHWKKELLKLKNELEKKFNTVITKEKLEAAIKTMNRERSLRRKLAQQMAKPNPPFTGLQLLDYYSIISGMDNNFVQYERVLNDSSNTLPDDVKTKRIRVLLTGVPTTHGAEKVIEIIENSGGIVACMESCTGLKPIYEDVAEDTGDPIAAIANKYFHLPCSVMTDNNSRLELIDTFVKEFNIDCVIDLVWQACLTYDIETINVKEFVETKLSLPYLKVETDYSTSDSERIRIRIETLFETIDPDFSTYEFEEIKKEKPPAT